jgi:predicted ATPase/DNA-binding CsgD family transcriptional regulator
MIETTLSPIAPFPYQPTAFVGRVEECRALLRLLANPECRLLTLAGPGGIGKTRLALEAGRRVGEHFADGAHFVPLQTRWTEEQVVLGIAEVLGIQFYGGVQPLAQVCHHLAGRRALLVLDNFEQVAHAAPLLAEIIAAAPGVVLLVTSRETLNLREEWVYRVEALVYPRHGDDVAHAGSADDDMAGGDATHYDAVELFAQHALRADLRFSLRDEYPHVVRICRSVEGMPLALELAAAWLRRLPCSAIADELERGLDILASSARNAEARHRSMRAVFDHSWALLDDVERACIRGASVFAGGFTRAAAVEVLGASLATLSALVDKSMLRLSADGRYLLHELVRQYAAEKCTEAGERPHFARAHSDYYLRFLAEQERRLKGREQLEARAAITMEIDNLRAAWETALINRDGALIIGALEALRVYFDLVNQHDQALALLTQTEACFRQDDPDQQPALAWAWIRAYRSWFSYFGPTGDPDTALAELDALLAASRSGGDLSLTAFCTYLRAIFLPQFGAREGRLILFREALALYRARGDRFWTAEVLIWVGITLRDIGDYPEMLLHYEEAVRLQLEDGNTHAAAWGLAHLGYGYVLTHLPDQAETFISQASAQFEAVGTLKGRAFLLWMRNKIALIRGDFAASAEYARQSHDFMALVGSAGGVIFAQSALGFARILMGEYDEGGRIVREQLKGVDSALNDYAGAAVVAAMNGQYAQARAWCREIFRPMTADLLSLHLTIALSTAVVVLSLEGTLAGQRIAARLTGFVFNHPQRWSAFLGSWALLSQVCADLEIALGQAYQDMYRAGAEADLEMICAEVRACFGLDQSEAADYPDALTEREREVLRRVAAGDSNREIAEALSLALGTVKWYLSQIYAKLGVSSRTQAVALARRDGLLS